MLTWTALLLLLFPLSKTVKFGALLLIVIKQKQARREKR
jgi:hypothetical protein